MSVRTDCDADAPDPQADTGAWLSEAIVSRRSVSAKRLLAPGPSRTELQVMITAALTAPDHCELRPWRFLEITAPGA